MALIKQIDVGFTTFDIAYTRIVGVTWERGKSKEYVSIKTMTYVDKAAMLNGLSAVAENITNVDVIIEGITLQKLYDALKKADMFIGAIDDL